MSDALPSDARVFAIASGKGGVGKTTTAVNVAAALAETGAETVVVDADLGMANIADLLDLSATPTLQDVLADEATVEEATHRAAGNLAVVPGATDLESYGGIDPAGLREVVATLREEFEYVLLDAGAGLSLDAALPLGLADTVVLVTTPRKTAARDTGKTRELAERIDATVEGVVVTRVREEPVELGPEAVAALTGTTVLAAIPEDGAVREALSAGRPIVSYAPRSPASRAAHRLVTSLTGREVAEPIDEAAEPDDDGAGDDEDATSIEELLEREADRSADVSALTGDSTGGSEPDAGAEGADEPPTLELESDGESKEERESQPDPLADDLDQPAAPLGEPGAPDPLADDAGQSENADVGAETDGDILIAEEAPLEDDPLADATDDLDETHATDAVEAIDPTDATDATDDSTSDDDDPMADIPRFDDDSDEDFKRGSQASDPLAADPLEANTAADIDSPGEEGSEIGDVDEARDTDDEAEGPGQVDEEETKGDEDDTDDDSKGGSNDWDEEVVGPRVEMDEPEDTQRRTGLLGRLTGLFR